MAKRPPFTIIRDGKLLDAAKRQAIAADILIKGDTIAAIGKPGMAAPASVAKASLHIHRCGASHHHN